jgi:hypothetical protein
MKMKVETYLNAMEILIQDDYFMTYPKLQRQYKAFRDKIIRIDRQQRRRIRELEGHPIIAQSLTYKINEPSIRR